MFSGLTDFTEWYHYAFLLLWLIVLLAGLKYFHKLESLFKLKDSSAGGSNSGTGLLTGSFILGFIMFLIWTIVPDFGQSTFGYFILYGFIFLLFAINAYTSFKHYIIPGAIYRFLIVSVLMIIYFYSGMLGGLFLISVFALVVIVYALFRLKKTLTIR